MLVAGQLLIADVRRAGDHLYWPAVWAYIAVWVVLLAMSLVVVVALATAGDFFKGPEEPLANADGHVLR